jgi:hypothetical protein
MTAKQILETIENVEITDVMIEAGYQAYWEWQDSDDASARNLVKMIFQRMESARND